jgi:hypothetical protein
MRVRRKKNRAGLGERRKEDVALIADHLKERGSVSLHVYGTGMLPLLYPGDIALIRREKLENMRDGDVVLFQRGAQLHAQRIGEEENTAAGVSAALLDLARSSGASDGQEYLGKIVRLRRDNEKAGRSGTKTTTGEGARKSRAAGSKKKVLAK